MVVSAGLCPACGLPTHDVALPCLVAEARRLGVSTLEASDGMRDADVVAEIERERHDDGSPTWEGREESGPMRW